MAAIAATTVTEGVMKPVLQKLATLMVAEYKKIKDLRKEVNSLQVELRAMEDLLEKMDAADKLDSQAKTWRKDVIEMSYDIEDCIDDFVDCIGEAGDSVGFLKKASRYLTTLKDRYHIANAIKKIKIRVIQASEVRKRYVADFPPSSASVVAVDPFLSAIYNDASCLVGIESQKEELINWVKNDEQQLMVMSIVGFGGLGKTTLANQVFHEVKGQFDCSGFVSVSQKPHITRIFNSLLSQLGAGSSYSDDCAQLDLIDKLREHLQDKS